MAIIPVVQSQTSRAIDLACEAMLAEKRERSTTLRCSSIGDECARKLWYALRWAHAEEQHEGRILRIFDNGHSREARLIEFLCAAGIVVIDRDPESGEQWRVTMADGWLTGSCDGIVEGVPEAPKTRHLLEIKTMKESRYRAWRRQGVKNSDPKYWVQMQCYMHGLRLIRALFLVENQDTREIEIERVEYDPLAIAQIEVSASNIAKRSSPPPRISDKADFYLCRTCPAREICHEGKLPERNCRTCLAAVWHDGGRIECTRNNIASLSAADQVAGCGAHLFERGLVPFDLIDADEVAGTITYRRPDGSIFVDGATP